MHRSWSFQGANAAIPVVEPIAAVSVVEHIAAAIPVVEPIAAISVEEAPSVCGVSSLTSSCSTGVSLARFPAEGTAVVPEAVPAVIIGDDAVAAAAEDDDLEVEVHAAGGVELEDASRLLFAPGSSSPTASGGLICTPGAGCRSSASVRTPPRSCAF